MKFGKKKQPEQVEEVEFAYKLELILLAVIALLIFIFLCVIKVIHGGNNDRNTSLPR